MSIFAEILGFVGYFSIYLRDAVITILRGRINKREFIRHLFESLNNSMLVVFITTMSIGMVSSLQLTNYFISFGMGYNIGGTNAISLIRELAPVITAVVISGRLASAWTAEIGSMKMTEQINALKIIKINLNEFLINPRLLAIAIAMPILNLIGILAGLWGGYLVSYLIANLNIWIFLDSIRESLTLYECFVSTVKAIIFGICIAITSCLMGLQSSGGSLGVGQYTTKSVVSCLIVVFCMNYLLSYIFFTLIEWQ